MKRGSLRGMPEGRAPSEAMKTLQFSNLICAIWCILFGNIPKRRKDRHLDDSLFSDNLNRIDILGPAMIDMVWYWNKIQILYSQISICPMSPCFLRLFLSLLPFFLLFLKLFFTPPPSFRVFIFFRQFQRGCFTPIGVIHLSLFNSFSCCPFPFFPFSTLFFLLFSLSFLPLFLASLSLPADFWCGDRRHAAPLPTGLAVTQIMLLLLFSVLCCFVCLFVFKLWDISPSSMISVLSGPNLTLELSTSDLLEKNKFFFSSTSGESPKV